ncbi:MAG: DUF1786 domain-containing protein [Chloroflexi bacterium]|nr:DUF1786 domain-containing protein [Chloroflexota bacterium]
MQLLAVDIGTGTQDIFLYNPELNIENGLKMVMPSPTMIVHNKIRHATRRGESILLTGYMMGGGPSQWAARDHLKAECILFATVDAARTFNDDLDYVRREMGVTIVSEDEADALRGITRIELKDFDMVALAAAFASFDVQLNPDAIGVAVFDHGDSPPNYSDRQFRFDYLDQRIREHNNLAAFAYPSTNIPKIMTRLQAVANSYQGDAPLVVMDTAPAAVLGSMFDPVATRHGGVIFCNVGNFHTLAFRMESNRISGVFEHHTGEIDLKKLDSLIDRLADGTLKHADVFDDMGHGALLYSETPLMNPAVVVTGPRRAMMRDSKHQPYFAVPIPNQEVRDAIRKSLHTPSGKPPWELV